MSQHPFSVLLVDDNPVNRELWSLYLSHEGYRLKTASNGAEALQAIRDEPLDLVLLDVMMPGLDGFQVLEELRREHSTEELPVIMATARDRSEDVVRGFDLGANDYVTKPVNLDVLLMRIQAQLRSKVPVAAAGPPPPPFTSVSEVPAGTVLEGRYRLETRIGQGNCGTVYRATHLDLHRAVAVKLLTAAAGGRDMERLHREGISACRIRHPNAVEVLDLSVTDTGIPYLVMELLVGHSLDEELRREQVLTPARCAEILVPACEVLAEAHDVGVIHRDVKPHNVFLHRGRLGEVVKVLDFGIAKMVGDSVASQNLTLEGSLVGTPAYMAPERLYDNPYDGRADVYSLGVMLYEMLTGRRPFVSRDLVELIRMHLDQEPQPPRELAPELSPALESLALRALEKDPADRPQVSDFARELQAAVGADPGSPSARRDAPREEVKVTAAGPEAEEPWTQTLPEAEGD